LAETTWQINKQTGLLNLAFKSYEIIAILKQHKITYIAFKFVEILLKGILVRTTILRRR